MRRGRYGNRVSFRVCFDKPEEYSTDELEVFLKEAIWRYSSLMLGPHCIKPETVQVRWPADYHGRYKDAQKDMVSWTDIHLTARQKGR